MRAILHQPRPFKILSSPQTMNNSGHNVMFHTPTHGGVKKYYGELTRSFTKLNGAQNIMDGLVKFLLLHLNALLAFPTMMDNRNAFWVIECSFLKIISYHDAFMAFQEHITIFPYNLNQLQHIVKTLCPPCFSLKF